jgi:hypothetical protein
MGKFIVMKKQINSINPISAFFSDPTSKKFIEIFAYLKLKKEINWEVYQGDIEKTLNTIKLSKLPRGAMGRIFTLRF